MSSTIYFVAGASRGIGLETVRQLSLRPDARVVAAARNPSASKDLQALVAKSDGKVETVVLDVTDEASIAAAVEATRKIAFVQANANSIDVLLLVAGVSSASGQGVLQSTSAALQADMKANYIGAAITTLAFIPLLQTSPKQGPAKIVIVSSALGSAGVLPHLPPSFKSFAAGYSASKAAINMWARKAAFDLASEGSAGFPRVGGWAVGINHPGLVRTDMNDGIDESTAGIPLINPDESVKSVLNMTDNLLTVETSGSFWDETGAELAF